MWIWLLIKGAFAAAGVAIPGIGPKTIMTISAIMIVGGFGFVCYMKGQDGKQAALAQQKLEFVEAQKTERAKHAEELRAARQAGEAEPPLAADRAERLRQCGKSPTCRERGSGQK
jgi:hypothetical protein